MENKEKQMDIQQVKLLKKSKQDAIRTDSLIKKQRLEDQ